MESGNDHNIFDEDRDPPYKPIFAEGDRVVFIRNGVKIKATVHIVSLPIEMGKAIEKMKLVHGEEEINSSIQTFLERDPDCLNFPVYGIIPDGFREPATWEVAQIMYPRITEVLTEQQYYRITGKTGRNFIAIETDLIPESWEDKESEDKEPEEKGDSDAPPQDS